MSVIRSPLHSPIYSPVYDPLAGKWAADSGGGHRYWRVEFTGNDAGQDGLSTEHFFVLSEIQALESYGGGNLIHGATISTNATGVASADQSFDKVDDGLFGTASVDRDNVTHQWAPQGVGGGEYVHVEIDLGAGNAKNINIVNLSAGAWAGTSFENLTPSDIRVLYSDDGSDWTLDWTASAPSTWAEWIMQGFVRDGYSEPSYTGSPHKAYRYHRVLGFYPKNELDGYAAVELTMALTSGGANQATGGTPYATREDLGFVAANAFDGNSGTFWFGAGGGAGSSRVANIGVGYDHGEGNAKTISEFKWTCREASGNAFQQTPKGYAFQGSDDGTNWSTLWTGVLDDPSADAILTGLDPLYV